MRVALLLILSSLFLGTKSQDIHFSQFNDSPLNLNPATTGDFNGSFRFVGNFRRQWASISSNPFRTNSFSADAHDILKVKNLGLGILMFQDIAGDSRMQDLRGNLALSYKIRLTADSSHKIHLGSKFGLNQFSMDYNDLQFGDQYNGNRFDPNLPTGQNFGAQNISNTNLGAGVMYSYNGNKINSIKVGFAIDNLLSTQKTFLLGDEQLVPTRYTIHSQVVFPFQTNWYLEPMALYMIQDQYQQFNVGATVRYDLDPRPFNYRAVFAGATSRIGDAANLMAGLYYGPWKFGLSYDINYSRLTAASNYRGGAEIAVIYIMPALLPKRVKYKYCPDYL